MKKEEQEKKRAAILENKRKAENKAGESGPSSKGPKGKEDDTDDPISKSLKERLAAGSMTAVVSKPGGKPSSSVPARLPPSAKPRPSPSAA